MTLRDIATATKVLCALLIVELSLVPHEVSDGRGTLDGVEAELPAKTARTDDADGREEVALAKAAVADIRAPSLRLEIRTKGLCWISAVADGARVVYRLMQGGERTLVEARSAITLRAGDAGSVAYSINGATGRPVGRSGEAVTIRITNDNLGSLYAEPESPPPPQWSGRANRVRGWPPNRR